MIVGIFMIVVMSLLLVWRIYEYIKFKRQFDKEWAEFDKRFESDRKAIKFWED